MMTDKPYKHKPMISFIITDYNIPVDLLKQCVKSVMSLNLHDDEREIILIDDGSELSPWDDLADFHSDIAYVRQDNRGLSAARNRGMEMASGQYIQFVDGDDTLITHNYNLILDQLKEYDSDITEAHKADIMFFRLTSTDTPRPNIGQMLRLFLWTTSTRYLKEKNLRASACGYIFRKESAQGLTFTEGIMHEDEEFTPLLILKSSRVYFTSIKAYHYRKRAESITNRTDLTHIRRRLADMLGIIIRLRNLSLLSGYEPLKRRTDQLSMDYLYNAASLTNDRKCIRKAVDALRDNRLFPLPLKLYTLKYLSFSIMSRCGSLFTYILKLMARL